jgi:hypothetical protein
VIRHVLRRVGAEVETSVVRAAVEENIDRALADRSLADDEQEEVPPGLAALWARLQELDEAAAAGTHLRTGSDPPEN